MSQRGDSTLACTVNKGICSERMIQRGCKMHQFVQVIRKRVSISEDPQAKNRVGIANMEDNCRDVCVVRATATEYDHPTEWTGVCSSHF